MTGSDAGAEFLKWLGQALVVGVGWYVVHVLSVRRDRDKARREMVVKSADALIESLAPILVAARTYHTTDRDISAELRIKMDLQDLAIRVQGFSDVCSDERSLAPCRSQVAGLRRTITGKHFEDEHVSPLPSIDQQLEDIAEAVLAAKRHLLRLKHRQFPAED